MYKVTVTTSMSQREFFAEECKFEPTWLHVIGKERTTVYSMNAVDHVDIVHVLNENVTVNHVRPSSQLSNQPGKKTESKEQRHWNGPYKDREERDDKEDRYSNKSDWQKP